MVSLTLQRHKCGGTTIPRPDEQLVLHSGECSFKFKFRLQGLNRLNVIMNEIRDNTSTFNKDTELENVTLKAKNVKEKKRGKVGEDHISKHPAIKDAIWYF